MIDDEREQFLEFSYKIANICSQTSSGSVIIDQEEMVNELRHDIVKLREDFELELD